MAKRVTVYDIAEKTGLSASTVSRVLNNSILISDEKRDLILAAAEELGYKKRAIRKHRNRAIINLALFLPSLQERHLHLFYEITELINTIRDGFGDTRVNIITDVVDRADEHISSKKVGGIDGAIFAFCDPSAAISSRFENREIPFALINRHSGRNDFVDCDHTAGTARLVRELLISRPDCSPCYIDFKPIPAISDRRRRGFEAACREAELDKLDERVHSIDKFSDLTAGKIEHLAARYDALVAFNDVLAVYLYQQALASGIRIPEDIALTGFDGSPVTRLISPVLTTMAMPLTEMIGEASRWLYRRIIERDPSKIALTLAAEFIRGETI